MASSRVPILRLVFVLAALVAPAALAAGCGSGSDGATARVVPGAGEDRRPASEAGGDAAAERGAGAGGGDGAAAPDASGSAGARAAPAQDPYEGDGDGDSSDDGLGGPAGAGAGGGDGAGAGPAQDAAPGDPAAAGAPAAGRQGANPGGAAAAAPAEAGGVEAGEAGAGDEDGVAVPASFVVEDGSATPMRAEVPAFLGIALEVENAETRPIEVRLRAPGAESFIVGPGQRVTRTVAGVPPGLYPLEVDGGASGAVVVAEG